MSTELSIAVFNWNLSGESCKFGLDQDGQPCSPYHPKFRVPLLVCKMVDLLRMHDIVAVQEGRNCDNALSFEETCEQIKVGCYEAGVRVLLAQADYGVPVADERANHLQFKLAIFSNVSRGVLLSRSPPAKITYFLPKEDRSALAFFGKKDDKPFVLINTHFGLSPADKIAGVETVSALSTVLPEFVDVDPCPVICVGDFNLFHNDDGKPTSESAVLLATLEKHFPHRAGDKVSTLTPGFRLPGTYMGWPYDKFRRQTPAPHPLINVFSTVPIKRQYTDVNKESLGAWADINAGTALGSITYLSDHLILCVDIRL